MRFAFFFSALLLFASGSVLADTAVDPAFDRFKLAITGNTARVTFGTNGTPLAMPAGSSPTAVGSSGAAFYNRGGSVPTKYGPLPVTVSQRFTLGKLAQGVASFAGPLGIALSIAAPFVFDWLADSGMTIQDGQIGAVVGGDSDGKDWTYNTAIASTWRGTHAEACAYLNTQIANPANHTSPVVDSWGPKCRGLGYDQKIYTRPAQIPESPGTFQPSTVDAVSTALEATPRTASEIEKILSETIQYPEIQPDPADTPVVTPTAPSPAKISSKQTVSSDGSVKTEDTSCYVVGGVGGVTHEISLVENCTTTTTEQKPVTLPDGSTATQTITTTGTATVSDPQQSGDEFAMPCGVSGTPPCAVKVDETGVPSTVTMADPFPQIQADQADKLAEIAAADGTAWEPIKDLFFLPSATQCVPFEMPEVMGTQVPSIDPCPVVGGIQQVVGVLWYIAGFWVMLGWVREVV